MVPPEDVGRETTASVKDETKKKAKTSILDLILGD
jgi:hypothetical protein